MMPIEILSPDYGQELSSIFIESSTLPDILNFYQPRTPKHQPIQPMKNHRTVDA